MTTDAKTYLLRAAVILKTNLNPLILPAALGVLFYLPAPSNGSPPFIFFMPLIILFFILPVIYGQYIEIITHNRQASYFQIFRTHWFNFFVVSLILGIPIVMLSILGQIYGLPFWGITKILSVLIDILSIYIFPLVFLLKKRFKCIPLGIKCLLGNINFSIPLVMLTVFPSILNLFSMESSETTVVSLPLFALNYIFWVVSLIIDFAVFVAAALILNEKLLQFEDE